MYTIQFMTKLERRSISITCKWFAVGTINQLVNLVYENSDNINGETRINDIISWELLSYPIKDES